MSNNEDRIKQRAYEIWEREGRPHGEDLQHWLQAFEELGRTLDKEIRRSGVKSDTGEASRTSRRKNTTSDAKSTSKSRTKPTH